MENINNCPICLQKADNIAKELNGVDEFKVNCPRCGKYNIGRGLFFSNISTLCNTKYLSGVIRNLNVRKENINLVSDNLKTLIDSFPVPKNPNDKMQLLLEYLFICADNNIAKPLRLNVKYAYPIIFGADDNEFRFYYKKAFEQGFLENSVRDGEFNFTFEGWDRVFNIKNSKKTKQVFVAMWFDKKLDSVWNLGFKPALKIKGYNPIRIDNVEHNGKICDRIIAEIRKSILVVADFTGHRGGVYFEAGFSLGLGIPVIWTCKDDDINNAHFDTRQYNHIVWNNPDDLNEKLQNRIDALNLN